MGMTSYYRIYDPIRGQKLLYDLIEYVIYGKVNNTKRLNPYATPFEMPPKYGSPKDNKKVSQDIDKISENH